MLIFGGIAVSIKINRKYVVTVIATAAVTCLLTNTVRDIMFVSENGKFVKKVNTVMKTLNDEYLFDMDADKIADYAALGMTVALDEPYTHYYDKESFTEYTTGNLSSYIGVGTSMAANSQTGKISVIGVFEGSPAEKAGVLPGDVILALNGEKVNASGFSDMAQRMRGDENENGVGTKLTLTISRNDGEPFDVVLTREYINKKTVSGKMLDKETAYIRISEFSSKNRKDENSKDTYDEFMEKISELRDEGMTKLVLDMRDNPGGDINVAMKIADELLPQCTMAYSMNKKGDKYRYKSDADMISADMAVLVNGNSASASEAVTAALKTHKRAVVIGTKTYGKGIIQTIIPFTDGSGMSVTSAKYYTEDGQEIHQKGVEPDITLEMKTEKLIPQLTLDEDIQLQRAIQELSGK